MVCCFSSQFTHKLSGRADGHEARCLCGCSHRPPGYLGAVTADEVRGDVTQALLIHQWAKRQLKSCATPQLCGLGAQACYHSHALKPNAELIRTIKQNAILKDTTTTFGKLFILRAQNEI